MSETSGSASVSTKLQRIAELARRMPGAALSTLSHHIDIDLLCEAHRRTRKDGAIGVGVTDAFQAGATATAEDCPVGRRVVWASGEDIDWR